MEEHNKNNLQMTCWNYSYRTNTELKLHLFLIAHICKANNKSSGSRKYSLNLYEKDNLICDCYVFGFVPKFSFHFHHHFQKRIEYDR